MTGSGQQPPVKRRKILDHAMQVLRETREKIDPNLLSLMKQRISDAGLGELPKSMAAAPVKAKGSTDGVFNEKNVDALTIKKEIPAVPKTSAVLGAAAYAAKQDATPLKTTSDIKAKTPPKTTDANGAEVEPVDRQKIAAIVMEYMRLREEKKPGH